MFFLFKALHLISMVTWFAGLFYLFRLFVYHVENTDDAKTVAIFKVMEHKLYYYITWPSMVATVIFGTSLLLSSAHNLLSLWLVLKLSLVGLLIIYHFYIGYTLKRFKRDDLFLTSKQCRISNEFPTLILISIIFIAVFRHYF